MSTSPQLPPELLAEVASKLTNISDISRFSRCNRVSHDLISPLLFRRITVPGEDISAIADAFRRNPHLVVQCRRLSLLDLEYYHLDDEHEDEETWDAEIEEIKGKICDDLTAVLEILAERGNVETFSFPLRDEYCNPITVPTKVWRAVGGLSSFLVELDLTVLKPEKETWTALCTSTFSKLRTFRIDLRCAHGWDCAPLQKMFDGLKELESLYLTLPNCCGPDGLDMSSSHPRLHTFYLSTDIFPDAGNSFLRRHPSIERFSIQGARDTGVNDDVLPRLKSLCIDQFALEFNPAVLSPTSRRPLTHLRLENMPFLTSGMVFDRRAPIGATLRHLELQGPIDSFRTSIPFFGKLLVLVPHLKQLVIEVTNYYSSQRVLDADDLSSLLQSISECTSIVNLRLSDLTGSDLPQSLLDDMGEVPKSLRYLCWDVREHATMYRIERDQSKTIGVRTDLENVFPGGGEDDEFASWSVPTFHKFLSHVSLSDTYLTIWNEGVLKASFVGESSKILSQSTKAMIIDLGTGMRHDVISKKAFNAWLNNQRNFPCCLSHEVYLR